MKKKVDADFETHKHLRIAVTKWPKFFRSFFWNTAYFVDGLWLVIDMKYEKSQGKKKVLVEGRATIYTIDEIKDNHKITNLVYFNSDYIWEYITYDWKDTQAIRRICNQEESISNFKTKDD